MSKKRAKDKAASEKMKAQLKINYKKKKAEKQSGSGPIIPDDPSPPVVLCAAAVPIVAAPVFVIPAPHLFCISGVVCISHCWTSDWFLQSTYSAQVATFSPSFRESSNLSTMVW